MKRVENYPKVYVAGAYSKGNIMENIRVALREGDWLLDAGFIPFIPHLTGFWDFNSPKDYETWMEYDAEWLKSCDAVIRLLGESAGADREVALAKALGIPVFTDSEDMVVYFGGVS